MRNSFSKTVGRVPDVVIFFGSSTNAVSKVAVSARSSSNENGRRERKNAPRRRQTVRIISVSYVIRRKIRRRVAEMNTQTRKLTARTEHTRRPDYYALLNRRKKERPSAPYDEMVLTLCSTRGYRYLYIHRGGKTKMYTINASAGIMDEFTAARGRGKRLAVRLSKIILPFSYFRRRFVIPNNTWPGRGIFRRR